MSLQLDYLQLQGAKINSFLLWLKRDSTNFSNFSNSEELVTSAHLAEPVSPSRKKLLRCNIFQLSVTTNTLSEISAHEDREHRNRLIKRGFLPETLNIGQKQNATRTNAPKTQQIRYHGLHTLFLSCFFQVCIGAKSLCSFSGLCKIDLSVALNIKANTLRW